MHLKPLEVIYRPALCFQHALCLIAKQRKGRPHDSSCAGKKTRSRDPSDKFGAQKSVLVNFLNWAFFAEIIIRLSRPTPNFAKLKQKYE